MVVDVGCEYHLPANYDDLLLLRTKLVKAKGVRIHHQYEVMREQEILAKGHTTVACIDRSGKVKRLPSWLKLP